MEQTPSYLTPGGVRVHCQVEDFDLPMEAVEEALSRLPAAV